MKDYTWEDWCWNSSIIDIADALDTDRWEFIKEIGNFWKEPCYKVYALARINDLVYDGRLNWGVLKYEEEIGIDKLYEVIVDYIRDNKEYIALIKEIMLLTCEMSKRERRRRKDEIKLLLQH